MALVVGVIVMALALFTRRPQRARKVGLILAVWLGVYTLVLLGVSLASLPVYLGLNQERCFDEMCYSVTAVNVIHTLPGATPGSPQVQGNYYLVTVKLRNAGLGTPQKPSNPALFIIDGRGKVYPNFQEISGSHWDVKIQAGDAAVRTVAFDLPVDVQQPGLVVSEGIGPLSVVLIGDEGSFFHAKTEFLLNP